jgi:putative DNA primase/helicase
VAISPEDAPGGMPGPRVLLVEQLQRMPSLLRERRQWLVWRFVAKQGQAKPAKMPYYATTGHLRGWPHGKPKDGKPTASQPQVEQGAELDRAHLVTFDEVLTIAHVRGFDGVGFAFLPDDGLIGIDVDGAIDPATGEVSDLCRQVIERCASYTELSPSGNGVHVITLGSTKTFKFNGIGLEVFSSSQYFTCTGRHWAGSPADLRPLADDALAWLRKTVDDAKAAAQAERSAARPPAPQRAAVVPAAGGDNDFQRVNAAALSALHAWVPSLFPKAIERNGGYRVHQADLGRPQLEEDLSIRPDGIVDYGVHDMGDPKDGRRSAVDLVAEWRGLQPKDALHWLAEQLGIQLPKRRLRLVASDARRPDPPPEGDPRPAPPPAEDSADGQPAGRGANTTPKGGGGGGLERLREHYALIYGTDTVWDGEKRRVMKVANLRLLFGNDNVKMWLRGDERRVVLPEHLVFEPGKDLPDDHINLFDGFAVEPVVCTKEDVAPMLELLWHLCSHSADTKEGVKVVFRWVLRWLALPLQKPGSKLRSALVFHGPQGTGKNLFFDGVASIYGKYGCMVGQTELEDKFNDWLSAKLMIIGNEVVTRQELYHHKNKLKWIITEPRIPIRPMQQSVRWESNHAQVVFLSNEQQPLALEKDDRRYLVVYTPEARDDDLYRRVAKFLEEGGAAKFMHHLLHLDLGDFDEHTKPVMTEAKQALIELSLKPAERFVNEWLVGLLPLPLHPCSAEQLYRVFRRWCDQTGERFPPPQAQFTTTAKRHVQEQVERDAEGKRREPALTYKVVTLEQEGARKSMRCWLPRGTGPVGGMTEGAWAASCVDSFESAVSRFGRVHQSEIEP